MPSNTPAQTQSVVLYEGVPANTDYEIDLFDLLMHLLAAWKGILLTTIVGAVAAFLITTNLIVPKYEATSTIYVLSRHDSAVNFSDLQIGSALTQDYIKVFEIWEVHEDVISNLGLDYTYDQMQDMLTVTNKPDTRMLDITVTSANPEEAARIANEYAKVSSDFIAETMSTEKPNIVSVALAPTEPVSPRLVRNVAIGGLVGLAIAAGIVTIIFIVDDKIRVPDDITRYTTLTTLAVMPLESARAMSSANRSTYSGGRHAHAKSNS